MEGGPYADGDVIDSETLKEMIESGDIEVILALSSVNSQVNLPLRLQPKLALVYR